MLKYSPGGDTHQVAAGPAVGASTDGAAPAAGAATVSTGRFGLIREMLILHNGERRI
jgi:hypothetical protein